MNVVSSLFILIFTISRISCSNSSRIYDPCVGWTVPQVGGSKFPWSLFYTHFYVTQLSGFNLIALFLALLSLPQSPFFFSLSLSSPLTLSLSSFFVVLFLHTDHTITYFGWQILASLDVGRAQMQLEGYQFTNDMIDFAMVSWFENVVVIVSFVSCFTFSPIKKFQSLLLI